MSDEGQNVTMWGASEPSLKEEWASQDSEWTGESLQRKWDTKEHVPRRNEILCGLKFAHLKGEWVKKKYKILNIKLLEALPGPWQESGN